MLYVPSCGAYFLKTSSIIFIPSPGDIPSTFAPICSERWRLYLFITLGALPMELFTIPSAGIVLPPLVVMRVFKTFSGSSRPSFSARIVMS